MHHSECSIISDLLLGDMIKMKRFSKDTEIIILPRMKLRHIHKVHAFISKKYLIFQPHRVLRRILILSLSPQTQVNQMADFAIPEFSSGILISGYRKLISLSYSQARSPDLFRSDYSSAPEMGHPTTNPWYLTFQMLIAGRHYSHLLLERGSNDSPESHSK